MDINIKDFEWKPIYSDEMELFNRIGRPFKAHPIIIFEYENKVYFLKAVSARYTKDEKGNLIFNTKQRERIEDKEAYLVEPYKNQITKQGYEPYFMKKSIIDTTQIFVMNKTEFVEYFKYENLIDADFYTRTLRFKDRVQILDQLTNNLNDKNFSLTLISKENGIDFKPKLIYSNQKFIDKEINDAYENKDLNKYIDLEQIKKYIKDYNEYFEKNKNEIDQEINIIKKIVKLHLDKASDREDYLAQLAGDWYNFNALNQKLNNKYTEYEIDEMWLKDIDLYDDKYNLSKYEEEYYKYHEEDETSRFMTNYEKLEKEVEEFKQKQKETKKKDQEMSM